VDLLDVGLQTPAPDPTYGEVSPANRESCARCYRPPADDSEFCLGCREYLLGDREEDPRVERFVVRSTGSGLTADTVILDEGHGREMVHICGDTRCVNPDHLMAVMNRENLPPGFLDDVVERFGAPVHPSAHYRHVHVSVPEQSAPPTTAEITAGAELIDMAPGLSFFPPSVLSALQEVANSVSDVDPAFWTALEDAAEAPERPVDPDRRRHGHAAICPRHGETRGGTCRRCL
jgi:hypothetical protein